MWKILCSIFLCPFVYGSPLTIQITKGIMEAVPVAFPGFAGDEEIGKVVANDLQNSGVFNILPAKGTQSPNEAFLKPEMWQWQPYEGAVLVSGIISQENGMLTAVFRIFDVGTDKLLWEGKIKDSPVNWRNIAHKIANGIYERLTGETGYFDTKILFTAQSGPPNNKKQRIAIIDQDGANGRFLTSADRKSLTPRSSSCQPLISFVSFHNLKLLIHVMNIETGQDNTLSLKGLGIAPQFSPDGKSLIFCSSDDGVTSIYSCPLSNLNSANIKRLTSTQNDIDISPSMSPDGKNIVFSSDRNKGIPKLFVMKIGDLTPKLLTTNEGSYFCPVWSPDGKWIAFVKRHCGTYYVGVMAADGSKERMLASDHVIDRPSWSPNSRLLVFSAQQCRFGPFSIYIVDFSGRSLRKMQTICEGQSYEGNHPDWQKFVK